MIINEMFRYRWEQKKKGICMKFDLILMQGFDLEVYMKSEKSVTIFMEN